MFLNRCYGTTVKSYMISFRTIFLLIFISISLCDTQYIVEVWEHKIDGFHAVLQCDATGADFGHEVPSASSDVNSTGCANFTIPEDACEDVYNPVFNRTGCFNYFAVVPRGNCSFSEKAYHAQRGEPESYSALIIYNDEGHAPVPMAGSKYAEKVNIPVVMVSHACMENIMGRFSAKKGYIVVIRAIPGYYDLVKYLIPLVAIVAFGFIILCISLAIRVCRERRRLARKRLSRKNLKKLPVQKYKKGDKPEMCAVCLDDFIEGEKLRILPCSHAYHCKCIDPWLTQSRKVCPICKRKVLSSGDSDSSDSDGEGHNSNAASGSGATSLENAALLHNAEPLAEQNPENDVNSSASSRRTDSRPPIRVVVLSPIDFPTYIAENQVSTNSRNEIVGAQTGMHAISDGVKRTLCQCHKMTQNMRVPWRRSNAASAELPPVDNDTHAGLDRAFGADNDAFEESNDTFHTAEDFHSNANSSSSTTTCILNPQEVISRGRQRHPASGKMTDVRLDLEVELLTDNEATVIESFNDALERSVSQNECCSKSAPVRLMVSPSEASTDEGDKLSKMANVAEDIDQSNYYSDSG